MKKTFVFVGGLPSHMLGIVSFTSWGQRAELTDEQAADLSMGGSAIVPAEQFDGVEIAPAELKKFAAFGAHQNATPEFQVKKTFALTLAEEFRAACEKKRAEGWEAA